MAQQYFGQQWGPQPEPTPERRMRRRPAFWLTIAGVWFLSVSCTAMAMVDAPEQTKTAAKAQPVPAVTKTVKETVTASPEPRATVTKKVRETVTARATVTKQASTTSGGGTSSGGGGSSVYYSNCSEARAAGAAPVYSSEPGYGRHLDRDGDGVGCDT